MNVLQNLIALLNHLSPDSTYRNVCAGILENLEEAAGGTIYDIAEMTNSSRTTVWRMVQKMGYRSFSDFHYELKQAVRKYTHYNRILPAEKCTSSEEIRKVLLNQTADAIETIRNHVDMELMNCVADEIFRADKVSFYAPFYSSSVFSFQQNLAMTGVGTAFYCLMPEMIEDSRMLTERSIVFANTIDHAETMDLTEVFENARTCGAKIYGIQCGKSKYENYIECELVNEGAGGVLKGTAVFDICFFLLSEIYRMKYID